LRKSKSKPDRKPRSFDPTKYSTRRIALKFAYLGSGYSGFEHHTGNATPLPTVEEELWKALVRCRLIFPPSLEQNGLLEANTPKKLEAYENGRTPVDWEGCEYSKCGRTDRGVSAFGQVVGLRVRSARKKEEETDEEEGGVALDITTEEVKKKEWDPVKDELQYVNLLNRILPYSIRIIAWCPFPSDKFDARFSCKEREYRYFFTSPAFLPLPETKNGKSTRTLDIEAMRTAASYLLGSHDFRNMCKIDGSKQLTEFKRRIYHASVDFICNLPQPSLTQPPNGAVSNDGQVSLYAFRIRGSAFLWHQVRCMVAILFLVGQGLEMPSLVRELLDIEKIPAKPLYEMASDRPLVLWDCKFSATHGKLDENSTPDRPLWDRGSGEDELQWIYVGDGDPRAAESKWGRAGIMEDLWMTWRGAKMDEILASQLMDRVAQTPVECDTAFHKLIDESESSVRVFAGEDTAPSKGKYIPIMDRPRMEHFEVVNAKWTTRQTEKAKD
jgi:tRNA pseudouridine38/39 synthase